MAKVVITITDREMIDIETHDINVIFDFEPELKDDSVTKAQMLAIKILNFIKGKKKDNLIHQMTFLNKIDKMICVLNDYSCQLRSENVK